MLLLIGNFGRYKYLINYDKMIGPSKIVVEPVSLSTCDKYLHFPYQENTAPMIVNFNNFGFHLFHFLVEEHVKF